MQLMLYKCLEMDKINVGYIVDFVFIPMTSAVGTIVPSSEGSIFSIEPLNVCTVNLKSLSVIPLSTVITMELFSFIGALMLFGLICSWQTIRTLAYYRNCSTPHFRVKQSANAISIFVCFIFIVCTIIEKWFASSC